MSIFSFLGDGFQIKWQVATDQTLEKTIFMWNISIKGTFAFLIAIDLIFDTPSSSHKDIYDR